MQSLKDYTTICSSAPSELLALMGLRSREAILSANLTRIERNRQATERFFARHQDLFSWVPPQAGTVCFPRLLPREVAQDASPGAEAFCARLFEQTGALLLPSTVYGYDDAHVRLGLGRDDLQLGLEVLEAFLPGR
jgi:aspartate/methionine/tyrosine aminotransferase